MKEVPFACTFGPKKKERRIQDAYKEKVLLAWKLMCVPPLGMEINV